MSKTTKHMDEIPVANYSDREFGEWLLQSLSAYHIENAGRFAFAPAESWFEIEYDISYDLAMLFQNLSRKGRENFNGGLKIALARLNFSDNAMPIVKTLLDTACMNNAVDILEVVLGQLRQHKENATFVDLAVTAIAGLATNAGNTSLTKLGIDCLEALARSAALTPLDAVSVFKLLCKLRPDRVADNLSLVRVKIDQILDYEHDQTMEPARAKQRRVLFADLLELSNSVSLFSSLCDPALRRISKSNEDWWQGLSSAERDLWKSLLDRCNPAEDELLPPRFEVPILLVLRNLGTRGFGRLNASLQLALVTNFSTLKARILPRSKNGSA
jgi:hypothetical protein